MAIETETKTKQVLMEITLVNNRTDRIYRIESKNEFGLDWEFSNSRISIHQRMSYKVGDSDLKCRFLDFSMIDTRYNTIEE